VLGEWDKSEKYLFEALNLSKRLDQYGRIAWNSIDLSNLYRTSQGDFPKARELLEEAIGILEKAGAKLGQMIASSNLVWTYIELGMLQKANDLLNVVHKFFLEMNDEGFIAWAEALRGMELRAQKKWEESTEHFEKSGRGFEHVNARRWLTYGFAKGFLCEYARVYLERDKDGDREKAHDLLGQALEIFQKIGAKKDIEKTVKLIEVLQPPHTQIREETVSSESLESTDLQSKIIVSPRELKIGESLELEIEVTNTHKKGTILLTKIMEIIPEGFTIVKKPELYRIEGDCLNMKEKQLDPSKTEEVTIVLTPKIQGTFHLKPKILYIDADGKEKTHEPKPTNITVKELGIKGWLKGER
jgi:tetratricopeptide (TPR) repeat protein